MSVTEISREMRLDRKTVRKYVRMDDFSEPVGSGRRGPGSKLDPYKGEIEKEIDLEDGRYHKQRFTATRMLEYLVEELGASELEHSYHLVRRYMNQYRRKKRLLAEAAPGTLSLVWHPGEAQADFGEADFETENGLERKKYLVLSFPNSNRMACVVLPGENCECVCQGLRYMFEFLGGVPSVILFDNATGIGRRTFGAMRETELFVRFRLHYGFRARYANIESGWEKGNVENAVGAFRRNRMVPPLRIEGCVERFDLERMLPLSFAFRADEGHYRKDGTVEDLYEQDKAALRPLPGKGFRVARVDVMRADSTGTVTLEQAHRYTLGPARSRQDVVVEKRCWTVRFLEPDGRLIREFPRQYGDGKTQDYDLERLLEALACKPNAWPNSPVREALDAGGFRDYVDSVQGSERRRALYLFSQSAQKYGFSTSSYALDQLCRDGRLPEACDVNVYCNRLLTFPPDTAENPTGVDLSVYDRLLAREAGHAQ